MPTSFTTVSNGQTIDASHINELHAPINTLETTVAGLAGSSNASTAFTSGQVPLARGGTGADLSATGGSGQYVKQNSTGGVLTVGAIATGDLPVNIDCAKLANGQVSNTEFQYLDGVTSGIQSQIDGKAATSHNHAATDIASGTLAVARGGTGLGSLGTAGQALIVNAGATGLEYGVPSVTETAGKIVCVLRKSANQTGLTNSVDTVITYDTEVFDPDGFHDNSSNTERITIPSGKNGDYVIEDILPLEFLGAYNVTATHRKNGTKLTGGGQQEFWSNESTYYTKTMVVKSFFAGLVGGDYIDLVGLATSANCIPLGGTNISCRRIVTRVS